jgi:hypothetical protein
MGCRTLVVFKGAGFNSPSQSVARGWQTSTLHENHEGCGARRNPDFASYAFAL